MNIAIIGFGVEGKAAYEYWRSGNNITICDQSTTLDLPADVSAKVGEHYLKGLDAFDLIVRSPFVRPDSITNANSDATSGKVTSCTNEFMRVCPTKNIIGVTGTKGKGTTSTLISQLLTSAGKRVHLGGNIGIAALDLLKNDIHPDDYVVLELSSFQLIDLQKAPHVAVCLMVVPEHQDWHQDESEYFAAKRQLFAKQVTDDIAIYFDGNDTSKSIAAASPGGHIPYFIPPGAHVDKGNIVINDMKICSIEEVGLLGGHNLQNICAALTVVWPIAPNPALLRSVITTFTGLEHRLEFVNTIHGVQYYDDSFGTTPETAMVALESFEQPKVAILGGSDKGADYSDLAHKVAESTIRKVLLIGEQASRIQSSFDAIGFTNYIAGGTTMREIVNNAQIEAKPGDVVLLSTGCASFDMFANYKDRGDQFKQAVRALV